MNAFVLERLRRDRPRRCPDDRPHWRSSSSLPFSRSAEARRARRAAARSEPRCSGCFGARLQAGPPRAEVRTYRGSVGTVNPLPERLAEVVSPCRWRSSNVPALPHRVVQQSRRSRSPRSARPFTRHAALLERPAGVALRLASPAAHQQRRPASTPALSSPGSRSDGGTSAATTSKPASVDGRRDRPPKSTSAACSAAGGRPRPWTRVVSSGPAPAGPTRRSGACWCSATIVGTSSTGSSGELEQEALDVAVVGVCTSTGRTGTATSCRVEPHRAVAGLAELGAVGLGQQRASQAVDGRRPAGAGSGRCRR